MPNDQFSTFYQKHKSLAINIFSILLLLGVSHALGEKGINNLDKAPWIGFFFILAFILEPWATAYSMGALNERRIRAKIEPSRLQKWFGGNLVSIGIFWGVRLALLGVLFGMSLQNLPIPKFLENQVFGFILLALLMVREGYVIYYLVSKKPNPEFKESYDFLVDIVLAVMLVFGQLAVSEIFRDLGIKGFDKAMDIIQHPFVILFFLLMFYLPIRYLYTLEDFTFAQTKKEKAERIIAFLVMILGFLFVI